MNIHSIFITSQSFGHDLAETGTYTTATSVWETGRQIQ